MKPLLSILLLISIAANSQTGVVGASSGDEPIDTTAGLPGDTVTHTSGPRVGLIFGITYETSPTPVIPTTVNGFNYPSNGGCCFDSHTFTVTGALWGSRGMSTLLNKSDPQPSGSSRSELNYKSQGEPSLIFERWYGTGMRPTLSYLNDQAPDAFFQIHAADALPPPVALWTLNGKYRLAINGAPTGDNLGNVVPGQWERWELHVKWDPTGTNGGIIEVWKNEVPVITPIQGKNSPAGVAYGPYPKWGIYKWPWKTGSHYTSDITTREYEFDETYYGGPNSDLASVTPDHH